MWAVIYDTYPNLSSDLTKAAVLVMAWMSNHTPLFYVDVIIYPCSNPIAALADLC